MALSLVPMRIAVDARLFSPERSAYAESFSTEVFYWLAEQNADHEFFFFYNESIPSISLPANITPVCIYLNTTGFIKQRWWFDIKLPGVLKKYAIQLLICPNGICSLITSLPQLLVVQDPSLVLNQKASTLNKWFYEKLMYHQVKKAKKIATSTGSTRNLIAAKFNKSPTDIEIIGNGISSLFKSVSWEQREEIKYCYAQSCEYFFARIIAREGKSILTILKAFSIFKKWQRTNMKLVLAGESSVLRKDELEKVGNYRYRNDVIITGRLSDDEQAKLVAGAYSVLYFPASHRFPTGILEAMRYEVPVVTYKGGSIGEIAGELVLYAGQDNYEEIAAQMKLIFKDEQLRAQLIEGGKRTSKPFSSNNTALRLWKMIEETVSK